MRVVIADDEPLVRERLRMLLGARSDCTLVAECSDGAAALEAIEAERPDLVLLDVQMPELDGFEVLEALPAGRRPAVVFVTAYDEYAVRAFDVNAVDYLLKPVEPERFRAAVERVAERRAGGTDGAVPHVGRLVEELRARRGHAERLVVRDGHRITFVRTADLDWLEAAGNYVRLHAGGRAHLLREALKSVEARLDPALFVRVHRSVIVNVERITAMEPYFHGEFVLTLRDGAKVTASRSYAGRLRAVLR